MVDGWEVRRFRRGIYLGLFLLVMTLPLSMIPIENVFSLEKRVLGYVVYAEGYIQHTSKAPFYIYAWRASAILFLSWLITVIIGSIRPMLVLEGASIGLGIPFILAHYTYLVSIGAPITLAPLTFQLLVTKQPLVYLDWGQVVGLYVIWRLLRRRNLVRSLFPSPKRRPQGDRDAY